jgi:hypothetical protein
MGRRIKTWQLYHKKKACKQWKKTFVHCAMKIGLVKTGSHAMAATSGITNAALVSPVKLLLNLKNNIIALIALLMIFERL